MRGLKSTLFCLQVRKALEKAAKVGEPDSKDRVLAIERATELAKAFHPELFRKDA